MFPRDVPVLEHDKVLVAVTEVPQIFARNCSEAIVGEWLIGAKIVRSKTSAKPFAGFISYLHCF